MRILTSIVVVGAGLGLCACASLQDQSTLSGFTSPSATGSIAGDLADAPAGDLIDDAGDGFAYAAGPISEGGLLAQAGLVAGTDVTTRPSEGTGTFTGRYELMQVSVIGINDNRISGFPSPQEGTITLEANFATGTLRGAADSLVVAGNMDGPTLTGTVIYRDVPGTLQGLVGADKTVGAFHGNNANLIYAGGFLADRN